MTMYPEEDEQIPIYARNVSISISLPIELVNRIDTMRKDVNRSRFLLRIIEKAFDQED